MSVYLPFIAFSDMHLYYYHYYANSYVHKESHVDSTDEDDEEFPRNPIIIISLLEFIQLIVIIVAASNITPTSTVIMLYVATPGLLLFDQWVFPGRKHTADHWKGSTAIVIAIFTLCLSTILIMYIHSDPTLTVRYVISLALYLLFSLLQSLTTLLKEHSLREYKMPIDIYKLNFWLYSHQLAYTLVAMPFIYMLQSRCIFV